jgi:hypothetical protein
VVVETFEPGEKLGFAPLPEPRLADGAISTISEAAANFSKIRRAKRHHGGGMRFRGAPKAPFPGYKSFFSTNPVRAAWLARVWQYRDVNEPKQEGGP